MAGALGLPDTLVSADDEVKVVLLTERQHLQGVDTSSNGKAYV